MIREDIFRSITERAKGYKYASMGYIDFDDCRNSEILRDDDGLILLRDKSKPLAMLHFAANDFRLLLDAIAGIPGKLRMHFVPKEFAAQLRELGFAEWGEYVDFFNTDIEKTAERIGSAGEAEYLLTDDCAEVAAMSRRCRLQSRGFEGESEEWFRKWLDENKVIIARKDSAIAGYCCVSIYDEGATLWIREIAVDPKCQGLGLGKKLIEQAVRYGAENGAVKGFLATDVLNKNAMGLFTKYDFRASGAESELQMTRE